MGLLGVLQDGSLLYLNRRYSLQTKGCAPTQLELLDLVTAKLDDQTILLLGRCAIKVQYSSCI